MHLIEWWVVIRTIRPNGECLTTEATIGGAVLDSPGDVWLYTRGPSELSTVIYGILTRSCVKKKYQSRFNLDMSIAIRTETLITNINKNNRERVFLYLKKNWFLLWTLNSQTERKKLILCDVKLTWACAGSSSSGSCVKKIYGRYEIKCIFVIDFRM